jgi:transcriptional regulator with XRE-family HTH domain
LCYNSLEVNKTFEVMKMTLGEKIKEQRGKSGFSQEKIAELVGVSRQAVTKWEANQSLPSMANLMKLAEIFGVSLSELTNSVSTDIPIESTTGKTTVKGVLKLVFAVILTVGGILTVVIVGTMSPLVLALRLGVDILSANSVWLGFIVGGGIAIFAGVVLFALYIIGRKRQL